MTPAMYLNGRNYTTVRKRINPCHVPPVKNKSIHTFSIDDNVLALNLLPGPKWYKVTVTEVLCTNVYNVFIHKLEATWIHHVQQFIIALFSRYQKCSK